MKIQLIYSDGRYEYIWREIECFRRFPQTIKHNVDYFDYINLQGDPNQPYLPIKTMKEFTFYELTDDEDVAIYKEL